MHCYMIKFETLSGGGIIFYNADGNRARAEKFVADIVEKELWLRHFEHSIESAVIVDELVIEIDTLDEHFYSYDNEEECEYQFFYYGGDCC